MSVNDKLLTIWLTVTGGFGVFVLWMRIGKPWLAQRRARIANAKRRAINQEWFDSLQEGDCIYRDPYECGSHIVYSDGHRLFITTGGQPYYIDGHWREFDWKIKERAGPW